MTLKFAVRSSQSKSVACPVDGCEYQGAVTRTLYHFCQRHAPGEMSREFVAVHDLHQCPYCRQWFHCLLRLTPGCKISHSSSPNENPERALLSLDSCTNDICESQCRGRVGSSLSLSSSLANKAKENTDSCSLSGKPSNNLLYFKLTFRALGCQSMISH